MSTCLVWGNCIPPRTGTPGLGRVPDRPHMIGCCAREVDGSPRHRRPFACEGGMSFGLLALLSWLATASFGALLLYLWGQRTTRRRPTYGRPPPYIPAWLVVVHVLLA